MSTFCILSATYPTKEAGLHRNSGQFHPVAAAFLLEDIQILIRLQTVDYCCLCHTVDDGAGFCSCNGIEHHPVLFPYAESTELNQKLTDARKYGHEGSAINGLVKPSCLMLTRSVDACLRKNIFQTAENLVFQRFPPFSYVCLSLICRLNLQYKLMLEETTGNSQIAY